MRSRRNTFKYNINLTTNIMTTIVTTPQTITDAKINDLTILRDTRIAKNPDMDNDYFDAYIVPINNEIIALRRAIVLANQL